MALRTLQRDMLHLIPSLGKTITHNDLVQLLQRRHRSKELPDSFKRKLLNQLVRLVEVLAPDLVLKKVGRIYLVQWVEHAPKLFMTRQHTEPLPSTERGNLETLSTKVRTVPAPIPLTPQPLNEAIFNEIKDALSHDYCLQLTETTCPEPFLVYPRGLVRLEARTYLVAQKRGEDVVRNFPLAKLSSAKVAVGVFKQAEMNFDLDRHLKRGLAPSPFSEDLHGTDITLKMWVDQGTAEYLSEVKLSTCQTLTDCENGKLIEAVLVLNAELESWLLSLGSHVKVLAPKVLVDRINVDIENMYNLYRRA